MRQVLSLPRLFRVHQTRRLVKVERLKLLHPVKTVVRCRPLQGLAVAQEANRRRLLVTTIMKAVAQETNRRRLLVTTIMKAVAQETNRRRLLVTTIMKAVAQEANRRRLPITTIMKEVRQVAIQPNHLQPIKLMMQQKQNLKNHGVKVQKAMIIPPSKSTLKMNS